jgi:hypothetical protein
MGSEVKPRRPWLRYVLLYAGMLAAECLILAITRGVNVPFFIVLLPTALGGAFGIFVLAFLLSRLSPKEARFIICVVLAIILRGVAQLGDPGTGW